MEGVTPKQVLDVVQLHDGVLQHSVARKLDRAGWKIPEGQYAEPGHAIRVSESAERIIKGMIRGAARSPAAGVASAAGGAKKKLDLVELFGSEHGLGRELELLGGAVLSGVWDLDDATTRRAVANLVVTAQPRACHIALPGNTSAEVQKFV